MSLSLLILHFQAEFHTLEKGNENLNFVVPKQGCFLSSNVIMVEVDVSTVCTKRE